MVELRTYQEHAVEAIRERYAAGDRATLLVMATGTGKTTVFGDVARRCLAKHNRVLVLAHRDELVRQAADRVRTMTGVEPSIEKAGESYDFASPVCVASVQTLRGERLERFPRNWFALVVIDEAHHAVAAGYRAVLDWFDCHKLGVTATADRADRRGLAEVFDSIAYEYPIARAVADGHLVPIVAKCLPLEMDLAGVKVSHGDFQAGDLGTALDPYLDRIAAMMARECRGRKTVVFLPLVDTAVKMRDALRAMGVRAVAVSGRDTMEKRRKGIAAFADGDVDVLCNAMLLTEGWDCPQVDCIVVLRPTRSRPLYTQMVGRGTRPHPGKDHLLLLDFLWMTERHDLCRPASLFGAEPEVAAKVARREEDGDEIDLLDAIAEAEADVAAEREEALAAELEKMRHRNKKLVDPLQFATSIQDADLTDYQPMFRWERSDPTLDQMKAIERFGVDPATVTTRGQASAILDTLVRRAAGGFATPKQIRKLESFGFRHVGTWSFEDASRMMARIAANRWRVPRHVDPATYRPGDAA